MARANAAYSERMQSKRARAASVVAFLLLDLLVVFAFIYSGRETRGSGVGERLIDALPFFVGVLIGWLAGRVWRAPRRVMWEGIIVWASTAAVGLVLRFATGEITDSRFVFISFISLGVFVVGWRGAAWVLEALLGREPRVVDEKYRR